MKLSKVIWIPLAALLFTGCSESNNAGVISSASADGSAKVEKSDYKGIQWVKNTDGVTFAEVKKMAEEQGKFIFMDYYTKWCGPCKAMDKNVFVLKEIGDYYNENFINFKVDAEVDEGINLAEQYKVEGYPTFIYTDAEGNELGRGTSIGRGQGHEGMIDLAKESLGVSEAKPWSWYQEQFANGNRELEFLKKYFDVRLAETQRPPSIADWELLYKATPEEGRLSVKGSQPYNYLLWASIPGNFFYDELLKHRDLYQQELNDPLTGTQHIMNVYTINTMNQFTSEEKISEALKRDFPKYFDVAMEGIAIDRMRFFENKDNDAYVNAYLTWVDKYGFPLDFNSFIGSSITGMKNLSPEIARRAIPLFKANIEESPDHFYSQVNYTYLLYKSGDKQGAVDHAKTLTVLTDSFESSGKMAQQYQVMKKIEAGEDPTDVMLMPREAFKKPEA